MEKGILNTIVILILFQAVHAQMPVANFSASKISGCAPLSVTFRDESGGDPKYWDWDLGNGQLAKVKNPSTTYSQPGTYSVTLVVRNQNGVDAITKTEYITVYSSPVISTLSADLTTACLPATIQFTGNASTEVGTISDWLWDFGDGSSSTQQNPNHTYTETGFYSVSLTVTSSNGCSRRVSRGRYIRMVAGISADFVNTAAAECRPPFGIAFTNESSGPGQLNYSWDFGNGTGSTDADPQAGYAADGDYLVQLIAQSKYGCSDTVRKTVSVVTHTADFDAPDSICVVKPVSLLNHSSPGASTWLWDLGDGTQSADRNLVKTYKTPGDYTVSLISRFDNCADTVTKSINITPKASVDFTATNHVGCSTPLTVQFQNSTPGVISWFWEFGDGQTSTEQNPVHTYTSVSSFDVRLTVETANGCGNSITKRAFVRVIPTTVKITTDLEEGCTGMTVHAGTDVKSIESVSGYFWDFGDGSSSTLPSPVHTYNTAGTFPMTVTVTTVGGCSVTSVPRMIRVGAPPSGADFSFDNSDGDCVSDTVRFFGTTVGANQWLWDFGDGQVSNEQHPKHLFRDTGMVTVTLTPLYNGCPGTPVTKANLFRKNAPVAAFDYSINCNQVLEVAFINKSITETLHGDNHFLWTFGDGATSNEENPGTHSYASPGNYTVQLTVSNDSCTSVYIKRINLVAPNADFTYRNGAVCKNTPLSFEPVEDSAKIATYNWMMEGILIGDERNVDTIFTTPGDRILQLTVTDNNGCISTLSKTIAIKGPVAKFSVPSLLHCGTDAVVFTDETVTTSPITEWSWNFGDGIAQKFTSPPFTHPYADTGRYLIRLSVKDADGCTDNFTLTDSITVSAPVALFGAAQTMYCTGLPLTFTDSSRGGGLSYWWDFGDGNTATGQNPDNTYADGKYSVSLVVTDHYGCKDTLTKTDYIEVTTPVAAFESTDTSSVCQLLETKFFNRSKHFESFYWDFGDGTTSTLSDPRHFYDDFGNYEVRLFVTGFGGCVDSAVGRVNVYDPVAFTKITYPGPYTQCNELMVDFTFTVPPGVDYKFAFGDGQVDSSGQTTLSHLYNYPNTYRPAVMLTDAQDCRVNVPPPSALPSISIKGAVPIFNVDNTQFCDSGMVFLTNYSISNEPIIGQVWDFGDNQTSADKNPPPHNYPRPGLYPVSLTVTTQSGCQQSFVDTVSVYRTPDPVISLDDITCLDRSVVLNGHLAHPPDTAMLWNWNFGDGRTSAERNNEITYQSPGTYNITLTAANHFGCKQTTSQTLTVVPLPGITTQNVVIPVGGSIPLPVSYSGGGSSYTWTPSEGLSCTACPFPVANPKYTTTYQVQVTDSNTCVNTAEILVEVACKTENYFVPNTFSPNGDGVNDVFYPRGRGLASVQSMKIYNRWGQLVFERRNFTANDPAQGWNGKRGGQALPPDVYVYAIEFVCENAQIIPMQGNVTLIR